ncbi:MAG: hypothetical protein ACFE8C_11025 [Promethearchaeota archaeon]
MINNNKNPSNCCKFCGWKFHQDILQRIIDNTQPVLCEFCGIELNISNVNVKTEVSNAKNEKSDDRDKETEHKKRATAKNFKKWISPQKYARNVIDRDDEFPQIFKDNLIIVVSRLIYFTIRKWEEENNISIRRVSLEKAIYIYIIQMIKPVLTKRIPTTFLNNLFKLSKEDFEEWLKLLQRKIASNQEYGTYFKDYLNWLIKIVFELVSNQWEMKNLPRFQATILKDLKSYPFYPEYEESKNKSIKYNAINLIDEMLFLLNEYPDEMYQLNSNRVLRERSGYTLKDLSNLWGHHDGYVSERLKDQRNNPNYILRNKNINELRKKLDNQFGDKANYCYELLDSHKNGNISFKLLIKNLRIELGRISKKYITTLEEIAFIFGYGYDMINYIRQHENFKLSKHRLLLIRNNLKLILGNKTQNSFQLIEKYEMYNPDILDYANQSYTITNPNFFSEIYSDPQTMYWFGWICSDGWISQFGNTHYQIQLKLKKEDRVIVERFAFAIGYDHNRIYDETYLRKDENGKLRKINSSRIFFGCKPMWLDLERLGIFEFKNEGKVPHIIKELIAKARKKHIKLIKSIEGRLALCFLLGFYDGDGNHHGGMSARILNTKRRFLEEIVDLFGIPNEVRISNKKKLDEKTHKEVWKTKYTLYLGPEIFEQMLLAFKNSLKRKRPEKYK